MANNGEPMHYRTYLHLDNLLSLQHLVSKEHGDEQHDEHLFITVHQVFELWYQQILVELKSVRALLPDHQQLPVCVRRLSRTIQLFKHVLSIFKILETMTPMDFREFRDYLFPASGFQSYQFRYIENIIGVRPGDRVPYNRQNYRLVFEGHEDILQQFDVTETERSLLDVVDSWLESVFTQGEEGGNFWRLYREAVEEHVRRQPEQDRAKTQERFSTVLSQDEHKACVTRKERRLSYHALQGALMVTFCRDEARWTQHAAFLGLLVELDGLMADWRSAHMDIVLKMIGMNQAGSGGSVGYHYLRATLSDAYKVFLDLSNMTGFLLPRSTLRQAEQRLQNANHGN